MRWNGIKTEAENVLCRALERIWEWITEGGDKGNASIRGVMREIEAWYTAMVMAGEGVKNWFMPGILQGLLTDLGMTPAEGRTEGRTRARDDEVRWDTIRGRSEGGTDYRNRETDDEVRWDLSGGSSKGGTDHSNTDRDGKLGSCRDADAVAAAC